MKTYTFLIILLLFMIFYKKKEKFTVDEKLNIYVINLEYDTYRWETISESLDLIGIPYSKIEACDTTTYEKLSKYEHLINDKELNDIKNIKIKGYRDGHNSLSPGSVGCYLSHIKVWNKIVENNNPYSIILEDDARFNENIDKQSVLNTVNNAPDDWDIIILGSSGTDKVRDFDKNKEQDYVKITSLVGTYSYIITKKCAKYILNKMYPIKKQIDYKIGALSSDVNIYCLMNNICKHVPFITNIHVPVKSGGEIIKKNWHVNIDDL